MDLALTYSFLLTGIALLLTYFVLVERNRKKGNWPPGPTPYPIIGNLFQFGRHPHLSLEKWAKEYGPIFSLQLATEKYEYTPIEVIFLTDPNLVKELYSDVNACGRKVNPIFDEFAGGNYGIISAEGSVWNEQRRFALRTLRNLGFSKSCMEVPLLEEAASFVNYLDKRRGQLIPGKKLFNGAVLNTIWSIVSGQRGEWDVPGQPEITLKASALVDAVNLVCNSGLVFVPILRFVAPGFFGWNEWLKTIQELRDFIDVTARNHAAILDPNNPKSFIDHYLIDNGKESDPNSSFFKDVGMRNLTQVLFDLFLAGSETNSVTLEYLMLYLSHYKDVQRKLQKEIDTVIGSSRKPSLSDRTLMPYTEAVIQEVLRISILFPMGAPHKINEDIEFHGYILPKDAILLVDNYNIFRDPNRFGAETDAFRPERFLNDDETIVSRHDDLIPFSVGKRQCLGENLARDTLFLFLTSIFQCFDVDRDPNCEVPDFTPIYGIQFKPKPFNIVVNARGAQSKL